MTRIDVAPVYTQPGLRSRRGVPEGIAAAFFVEVDGGLEVTTDPTEATHSLVLAADGGAEIAAYRSDSTMILGEGQSVLAPVLIPVE